MNDSSEYIPTSGLSPEWATILKSISVKKNREGSYLNFQKMNWTQIRMLTFFHGILPLVYGWLKDLPPEQFPSEEKNHMRMIHLQNAGQNLILVQHLFQILDMLSNQGVQVITYKGPVLALRAYGDLSRRQFVDLDFLVRDKDFAGLYQGLVGAGFKAVLPLNSRMVNLWSRSGREYIFIKDKIYVDVHFRISEGPAFFQAGQSLWKDITTIKMNSHQVPVLSLEDSLLMLTIHGSKHSWQLLKWVVDIAYLVAVHPEINWNILISKARQIGCLTMLGIGLVLAQFFCELDLQTTEEIEFLQSPRIQRLAKYFSDQILSGYSITKFQKRFNPIKTLDSFSKKMRYIGYYAFTPKFKDLKTIPLPSRFYFLYYVLRPIRLVFTIFMIPVKFLFKR
jgi:hypothetical protein